MDTQGKGLLLALLILIIFLTVIGFALVGIFTLFGYLAGGLFALILVLMCIIIGLVIDNV